jgi:hypothetical protein
MGFDLQHAILDSVGGTELPTAAFKGYFFTSRHDRSPLKGIKTDLSTGVAIPQAGHTGERPGTPLGMVAAVAAQADTRCYACAQQRARQHC